jgi:putative phage-type endonuclease
MIIINCEQRSEAWYQARLGRFTASVFSNVMAGESTATYKDLITKITGEILTGEIEESYTSYDMERGIDLEPDAISEYESLFGNIKQVGFIIPDEDDELNQWVGVSPDGMQDNIIQEFKCPKLKTHLNYIKSDVLPNTYKWQVQGQLMITGAEYCDFMSYYPKLKPFIIRVEPDNEMHKQLRDRLNKSIELVKKHITEYNNYDYMK